MKILSQQPWETVVDFMLRYPDSPEEAKALGRIVYLLRDSIHEKRWDSNRTRVYQHLCWADWGYMFNQEPEQIALKLNDMVYGDDDESLG